MHHILARDLIGKVCAYCKLHSASAKEQGRFLNPQFPTHPQLVPLRLEDKYDQVP